MTHYLKLSNQKARGATPPPTQQTISQPNPIAMPQASSSSYRPALTNPALRPNSHYHTPYQREQSSVKIYGGLYSTSEAQSLTRGKTEWDILKENHRFIRDDEDSGDVSWEERLARAYESKLFKEFALVSFCFNRSLKGMPPPSPDPNVNLY